MSLALRWPSAVAFTLPLLLLLLLTASCAEPNQRTLGLPGITEDDFPERIERALGARSWTDYRDYEPVLDRATIEASLEMGIAYAIAAQKPDGTFNYDYDWIERRQSPDDHQVRQAGAAWGLALAQRYRPSERARKALLKSLDFFFEHSVARPDGSLVPVYPGERWSDTGTTALIGLSLIDFLRFDSELTGNRRVELETRLDGYLEHLLNLRLDLGQFAAYFDTVEGVPSEQTSPYYDGEALLCLTKAARYLDRPDLIPVVEELAASLAQTYAFAWVADGIPDRTKGFYQWGTMAYWEYQQAGWKHAEVYRDVMRYLAHWMIHTHKTLIRDRNTAYAYEGLIHVFELSRSTGDEAAASEIFRTSDLALAKLMSWQVGGPLADQNPFLLGHPTDDPLALGGFMNHRSQAPHTGLRIDVTAHTIHALGLALEYLYPE